VADEGWNWSDRPTWAQQHRAFHEDEASLVRDRISRALSHYGTAEEITAAIAELQGAAREARRTLRQARAAAGSLVRQPRERLGAYNARARARSEAEEALVAPVTCGLLRLQEIRAVLVDLGRGQLPHVLHSRPMSGLPRLPILENLFARYRAAQDTAVAAAAGERSERPIDDAAWAEELRRRAAIEAAMP
jgi:hypothetical protein